MWRGGTLLASVSPTGGTRFQVTDHLGSPRVITDRCGGVLALHTYMPFGEELTSSQQDDDRMKFTGHERDLKRPDVTTDDLDYMHARYYNPWLIRFLSVDPAGGKPEIPQSWNKYGYARNNPVNMTDPDGREGLGALVGLAGGAVKAAWENIQMARQRPVTNLELFQNLGANLAGGTLTGALGGFGKGFLTAAAWGGVGGVVGGGTKRFADPSSMNTEVMDKSAIRADLVGGSAGGALGSLTKSAYTLFRSPGVEAAKVAAWFGRAQAATDRTLASVSQNLDRLAAALSKELLENAEGLGTVLGALGSEAAACPMKTEDDKAWRN